MSLGMRALRQYPVQRRVRWMVSTLGATILVSAQLHAGIILQ
jgi:hypothetical protein